MSHRRKILQHYEPRVRPGVANHEILDWGSREAQLARFKVLVDAISTDRPGAPARRTLLDVGCGLTDLCDYLEAHGAGIEYFGVDLTLPLLREVRRRHPERRVLQADMFSEPPLRPASFDLVYCSGVFNLRLADNHALLEHALPPLFALARRLLVVNLLHARTAAKYPHCFYYDPEYLLPLARRLTPRVRIIDDYLENDFTLILEA